MALELVQTVTVGSGGAASIEFTNIPQTGKDLLVLFSLRITNSTGLDWSAIRFNSDTGSNYSGILLRGDGSAVSSLTGATTRLTSGAIVSGSETANTFSNNSVYVSNYTSTSAKSISSDFVAENNATATEMGIAAGNYSGSSGISTVTVFYPFSNLAQHSTASLYLVTGPEVGGLATPKATGGSIAYDGTYWYHTFKSSGTFTPTQSLSCDVLVVAGGGGGAGDALYGGGGAGGLQYFSSQSVSTAQTVTIGAGGSRGFNTGSGRTNSANGSNSSFGNLTASVGGGRGGYDASGFSANGGNGGSGGGAAAVGASVGTGTSGQGNNGGNRTSGTGGGGGGGAGAAGQNGQSNSVGGVGGNGVNTYSAIATATGTGRDGGYYAGGGAGGGSTFTASPRAGGLGGGGQSGFDNAIAEDGYENTGGGGGASADSTPYAYGGNGGSGIVIVRYAV